MTNDIKDLGSLKQAIGAAIREARLARGVTQEELAHAFDVDRVTIARYERGTRTISAPAFLQMLAFLGREIPLGAEPPSAEVHRPAQSERVEPTTARIIQMLQERPELAATVKDLFETLEIWQDD